MIKNQSGKNEALYFEAIFCPCKIMLQLGKDFKQPKLSAARVHPQVNASPHTEEPV